MNSVAREIRSTILGVLSLLLLGTIAGLGCASHSERSGRARNGHDQPKQMPGLTIKRDDLSQDLETINSIHRTTTAWNHAMAPLVRDYLDSSVPSGAWVSSAKKSLLQLDIYVRTIEFQATLLRDPDFKSYYTRLANNYRHKLNAFTTIVNSVAGGSSGGEKSGLAQMDAATKEGRTLVREGLALLSRYVDRADLDAEMARQLREKRDQIEALLKSP